MEKGSFSQTELWQIINTSENNSTIKDNLKMQLRDIDVDGDIAVIDYVTEIVVENSSVLF